MKNAQLKALVIGSEPHSRGLVVTALEQLEGLQAALTATSGAIAMARLQRLDVDMIVLDIESADNETLDTLSRIHRGFPRLPIVVMGEPDSCHADRTVKALEMGAVDFIARPTGNEESMQAFTRQSGVLVGMLRSRMSFQGTRNIPGNAHVDPVGESLATQKKEIPSRRFNHGGPTPPTGINGNVRPHPMRIDAVVIGVSTGGPNALLTFIPRLPGDLGVPVLLVQHMPKQFTASLAESLNKRSALTVKEAEQGEIILPDTVYIAPGGRHMVASRGLQNLLSDSRLRIGLNDDPPVNSCRPSVDVLFSSVARLYGQYVLALVMTGMGGDGMQGAREVRERGGYCLSQTDDTCVVYGMPKAVNDAGLANERVPLDRMARRVMHLVKGQRGDDS